MELVVVLCVHRCYLFINKDWTWNRFDAEIILPKPGASFTVEQRARLLENFRLMDDNRDGRLTAQEVGILSCAPAQEPTNEDLEDLIAEVPPEGLDLRGLEEFSSLLGICSLLVFVSL